MLAPFFATDQRIWNFIIYTANFFWSMDNIWRHMLIPVSTFHQYLGRNLRLVNMENSCLRQTDHCNPHQDKAISFIMYFLQLVFLYFPISYIYNSIFVRFCGFTLYIITSKVTYYTFDFIITISRACMSINWSKPPLISVCQQYIYVHMALVQNGQVYIHIPCQYVGMADRPCYHAGCVCSYSPGSYMSHWQLSCGSHIITYSLS